MKKLTPQKYLDLKKRVEQLSISIENSRPDETYLVISKGNYFGSNYILKKFFTLDDAKEYVDYLTDDERLVDKYELYITKIIRSEE